MVDLAGTLAEPHSLAEEGKAADHTLAEGSPAEEYLERDTLAAVDTLYNIQQLVSSCDLCHNRVSSKGSTYLP